MKIESLIDATVLKPVFNTTDVINTLSKYNFRGFCSLPEVFFVNNDLSHICDKNNIKKVSVYAFPFGQLDVQRFYYDVSIDEIDIVYNPFMNNIDTFKSMSKIKDTGISTKLIIEPILIFMRDYPHFKKEGIDQLKYLNDFIINEGWNTKYIKTSTGFFPNYTTTVGEVRMLREIFDESLKIKVSGGIKTLESLMEYQKNGGDIFGIGINNAVKISEEYRKKVLKEGVSNVEKGEEKGQ